MKLPSRVLAAYNLGSVRAVKLISSGLIHQTYQIRAANGTFVLQKLHPVLASDAIATDFYAVTAYLASKKFPAPHAVLTKKGEVLAKIGKDVWRMQTYLPGKTETLLKTPAMAREAGKMLAKFHKTLDGIDHTFQSEKILHETEKIFIRFEKTIKAHYGSDLLEPVTEEIAFITKWMPKFFLPAHMPMRAIHGDPKISNFMFTREGKASGVVDLDTCNRRPILVELGDAFRSWCGKKEDDPKNEFRLEFFRAGWKGYAAGSKGFLTAKEQALVAKSAGTITLELATRFLTDYFDDNYFGWDAKKYKTRRAANLARARGQIALFKDIQAKMPEMKKIVGV